MDIKSKSEYLDHGDGNGQGLAKRSSPKRTKGENVKQEKERWQMLPQKERRKSRTDIIVFIKLEQ